MLSVRQLVTTTAFGVLVWGASASAAPPVVTTVPANPNNAAIAHDIISGKATTLKGAVDEASIGSNWTWDPGDGSGPIYAGNVDANPASPFQLDDAGYNPYWAVWAEHTYAGSDGDLFIATLTVDNGVDAPVSKTYRVIIRQNTLPAEVNAAIGEALWHMHRNQFRFDGTATGGNGGAIPMGRWDYPQTSSRTEFVPGVGNVATVSATAASVNAFEANGYLEIGPASSPYTDTVARGLKYTFARLATEAAPDQTLNRPAGSPDIPDTNGNGFGIRPEGLDPPYQSGMLMDAIVATGTPTAVATTGPAGVIGRTYGDIVQDMVDYYAYAQSDSSSHGGWRYGAFNNNNGSHDNSTSGWAGIGLVAAEDLFTRGNGTPIVVPPFVKQKNIVGLEFTDNESNVSDRDGIHGYASTGEIWGPFGTSGAAMVQMVLDDIASTTDATPDERWIRAENLFRRRFNDIASGNNFKNYYYGMFNFAKAMRTAVPAPVAVIGTQVGAADGGVGCGPSPGCAGNGPQPLDWYNNTLDGLARTVVDYQIAGGVNIGGFTDRPGNSHGNSQDDHNTPWATQILTRTLFQAGPVANATANPNPTAEGVAVNFDPSGSFHQDPARSIVLYEWDFDDDGVFDLSTPTPDVVQQTFTCSPPGNVPCSFSVRLRVTDDNGVALVTDAIVQVNVTIPPHPPTADADGPYLACLNEVIPLDGSGSLDIDEGQSQSGNPPFDTITLYEWDLDIASGAAFDVVGANGPTPDVSFATLGDFDIGLRVTDNTAAAFPGALSPDLTDSDFTQVSVVDCSCSTPISIRGRPGQLQLTWAPVAGAASYDIYISTTSASAGFSLVVADHVTATGTYLDTGLINGTQYWYRATPKDASGDPLCDSSLPATGIPAGRSR